MNRRSFRLGSADAFAGEPASLFGGEEVIILRGSQPYGSVESDDERRQSEAEFQ